MSDKSVFTLKIILMCYFTGTCVLTGGCFYCTFGQGVDPHFHMGEIPTANLSTNFVEPDPPADCQLTDNPVIAS